MEIQRIESEFEICMFGCFFPFVFLMDAKLKRYAFALRLLLYLSLLVKRSQHFGYISADIFHVYQLIVCDYYFFFRLVFLLFVRLLYLCRFRFDRCLVGWFRVHHSIPFAGLYVLFSRSVCACVCLCEHIRCVNMCVSCTELTHVEN